MRVTVMILFKQSVKKIQNTTSRRKRATYTELKEKKYFHQVGEWEGGKQAIVWDNCHSYTCQMIQRIYMEFQQINFKKTRSKPI